MSLSETWVSLVVNDPLFKGDYQKLVDMVRAKVIDTSKKVQEIINAAAPEAARKIVELMDELDPSIRLKAAKEVVDKSDFGKEMYANTIDRKGFVFKPIKAKHYTPQNLETIYYKARKGITDIPLKDATRSPFIVWHLAEFNDIRYTQEHAGHKDIATTQKYFDLYNQEKRYLELVRKRGE